MTLLIERKGGRERKEGRKTLRRINGRHDSPVTVFASVQCPLLISQKARLELFPGRRFVTTEFFWEALF